MIQASELRIGNLVFGPKQKSAGKVVNIERIGFALIEHKPGHEDLFQDKELFGIPLTEDWLLRCGATKHIIGDKDIHYMNTDNKPNFIAKPKGNYFVFRIHKNLNSQNTCEIELSFVHELQNIYFLIKGEELEFKN
jgi:hypothetical protein